MRFLPRRMNCIFFAIVVAALCGCGSAPDSSSGDTAIQVNDVTISTEEFNDLIKLQAYSDPEMNITRESRQEYVDYIIRKELMIQEAIRLKMDRNEEFIKTIETYWESTLIRRLLDVKTQELKKRVLITEEEMAAYYKAHEDQFLQPFDAVKAQIKKALVSKRVEAELEAWSKELRSGAKIRVNPDLTTGSKG